MITTSWYLAVWPENVKCGYQNDNHWTPLEPFVINRRTLTKTCYRQIASTVSSDAVYCPEKCTIFDLLKILVLRRFVFYEILLLSNSDPCIITKQKQEVKAPLQDPHL